MVRKEKRQPTQDRFCASGAGRGHNALIENPGTSLGQTENSGGTKPKRSLIPSFGQLCIEVACIIREVYHIGYRHTQGFLESLIASRGWKGKVPDYGIIQRRVVAARVGVPLTVNELQEY